MAPPANASDGSTSSAACTLEQTNGTEMRFVGARSYTIHVPAGLARSPVPLLVSLHGSGITSQVQESITGWSEFADRQKFIVAYPQALGNMWNFSQGSYDVGFLRQVVDDISARWCVDANRVYAEGRSNGAYMSQRLACDAPDKFASVAGWAGGSPTMLYSPCDPARPIGVALFHGEDDTVVPIAWGQQARDEWVTRNRCSPKPTEESVSEGTLLRYRGCGLGVEVWWRTYPDQGHTSPSGDRGEDMRSTMWDFLQAHPRPRKAPEAAGA